jgi:hypothetical protein
MQQDIMYIYRKILNLKYTLAVWFSEHYTKSKNSDWLHQRPSSAFKLGFVWGYNTEERPAEGGLPLDG